jgi:hypothetical protein
METSTIESGAPNQSAWAPSLPPQLQAHGQLPLQAQSAAAPIAFPFPLPKTYGVYAGGKGQLTELATLPIKIPDARVRLSAEVKTPGQAVVASGKLTFVVFRRELLNSAPRTISVRVVAQVARDLRFVDRKPIVTPIHDSWRISSKSYEFKVAPLDGHPEMVIVGPLCLGVKWRGLRFYSPGPHYLSRAMLGANRNSKRYNAI